MARLLAGMKILKIPKGGVKRLTSDIRAGVLTRLLKQNRLEKGTAALRITVTRGVDFESYLPSRGLSPTVIITARAVDAARIARIRKKGVKGILLKGALPALAGVKTVNFLPNVLGRVEAKGRGGAEGIFVDYKGYVTEGTASNIFIVKRGVIKTPPLSKNALSAGVLPGTTRAVVIKRALAKGIPVKETRISTADLLKCDEAFLTSSIIGVVGLVEVDSKAIGPDAKAGPVTRIIQEALL